MTTLLGSSQTPGRTHYDPPISEPDFDHQTRLKSREQRLRTVEVLKLMYGETKSMQEACTYLMKALGR